MREVHGKKDCPFAWRVRIAAREKGLPFEWLPYDVAAPDARALAHNPEKKSPKLIEDGFELIESLVIIAYLDEANPGTPLQPEDPRARALMRLRQRQLAQLEVHVGSGHPPDKAARDKVAQGYDALARMLRDGRQWLGGDRPDLSDIAAWPFLWKLDEAGLRLPEGAAAAYWARACTRDSLASTRPR